MVPSVSKLPNGMRAVVPQAKVTDYLLSETHPQGRFKARFFRSVGFTHAADLTASLLAVARTGVLTARMSTAHGRLYVVDGKVETPTGIPITLRTVWIQEYGTDSPRLVTAYPRREREPC